MTTHTTAFHRLGATLLPLCLAAAAGGAQAQVSNGNFGNGLAGWNPLGDAVVRSNVLTLTTAYTTDDDAPYNLSGTGAAWIDAVEQRAGVAGYTLDFFEQPAYEGSVVTQTFSVAAGSVLRFDWSFSSRETSFLDRAFVALNGQVTTLATRSGAPVGTQTFTRTFTQAGSVQLSFGVVDTGDVNGVSTLNIGNVSVTAVPEPGMLTLMLSGVLVLGGAVAARRRPG